MREGLRSQRRLGKEVVERRKMDINDLFDLSGESRRKAMNSAIDKGKNVMEARGDREGSVRRGNSSANIVSGVEEAYMKSKGNFEINWAQANREINEHNRRLEQQAPPVHAPQQCIMTLEYIEKFLNRSKGLGTLSTIHGVVMTNNIPNDVNPRTSLRKEIMKDLIALPPPLELDNTPNMVEAEGSGTKIKTRYSVCEQIAKQLSDAGWVVFFRPCNDAEKYDDAVYLSPDGKACWSIILAYYKLKHHFEAGDGEGMVHGPGFQFTPVPQEDLKLITGEIYKEGNVKALVSVEGGVAGGNENENVGRRTSRLRVRRQKKTQEKKHYDPYQEKKTVLSWMIDMGTIKENGKVHCEGKAVLYGEITRGGIRCACCNEIVTISEFEAHSKNQVSDPLKNIHVEGGASLLQCMEEAWNKQDESYRKTYHFINVEGEDPNDDICSICKDAGNLICCDTCPSSFHPSCLNIQGVPDGKWHCIYCRCKYCGLNGAEQMQSFTDHKSCLEAIEPNAAHSEQPNLCGNRCKEVRFSNVIVILLSQSYARFEMLAGVKHEIKDGFSWSFLRRSSDVGTHASQIESREVECNSELAVAMLRGDEIITVVTIRIHRNQVAEIPFIGTRPLYRRQGMCRRLLNAIEPALSFLNVELVVIPSVTQLRKTWTRGFGFEPLDSTGQAMIKTLNLLVFPHTDTLQKKLPKCGFSGQNLISAKVSNLQLGQSEQKEANNRDKAGTSGSDFYGERMDIDQSLHTNISAKSNALSYCVCKTLLLVWLFTLHAYAGGASCSSVEVIVLSIQDM
ncbi:hypothetical protein VNO77_17314 [Canavalia gladiata]|uniref:Uncharacterized protein n=1 Tax=Canavalia gladiata TaxID=3824 RepID=A0AAN9QIM8_CANGL